MKPLKLFAAFALVIPVVGSADEWVLRKNQGNMNCYVQAVDDLGNFAQDVFSKHPTRKAACEAAKQLKTDGDEPERCPAYSPNTTAECKKDEVELK